VSPPARSAEPNPALAIRAALNGATPGDAGCVLAPDPATLDIADAERIVAFGRGAFSQDAVALVRRLADLLGAAVGGSRPAADEGWLPFARQIGLTGAIVRPKLYVAVGISGAPYHMVGIKDPGTLIAVNRDPDAAIFASADLGIVGDLYQVLPELIAALERGRAPAALQDHARNAGAPGARS
jgi:electron transfer flavoprotein alpha subunit